MSNKSGCLLFAVGLLLGVSLSIGAGFGYLYLSSGAGGVGTYADEIRVTVLNKRTATGTIELVHGADILTSTKPATQALGGEVYRIDPDETITFRGTPTGFYDAAWFRFAATDQYSPVMSAPKLDQPTGMIELRSGRWEVVLYDKDDGSFGVRIDSLGE